MSQFTISSFPVTFVSYFFCSNNKLPTSYHTSSSQMKRCKSHSDCPGGAAPLEKKGFCPFLLLFFFLSSFFSSFSFLFPSPLPCPHILQYEYFDHHNPDTIMTTEIIIIIIIARTLTSAFLI